jgi:chlorobactene glucosyltransferase
MNLWWLVAAPAALATATTLFNVVGWPRNASVARFSRTRPPVSVLIPARNEEKNIARCVLSILPQLRSDDELIVCDDGSTDQTPLILRRLQRDYRQQAGGAAAAFRVIDGRPLQAGWVGKPNACDHLAQTAGSSWWVYVDADVEWREGALNLAWAMMRRWRADVLTAVPEQRCDTAAERVFMPWLDITYVSWLPMPLVWASRDPRFLAANGQFLAVTREAMERTGGFAAIRDQVVDDMALCRRAKLAGLRVLFADGSRLAACRMYEGWEQIRDGFSKNLYLGIGARPAALVVVLALYAATFLVPWLLLPVALVAVPAAVAPAAMGVVLNLVQRLVLMAQRRHHWLGALLHPVGVVGFMAIAVNSWRWFQRGRIEWSGRVYPAAPASGAAGDVAGTSARAAVTPTREAG